jgi:hypothetical protein
MKWTRVAAVVVTVALLVAGCGTAQPSSNPGAPGSPVHDPAGPVARFAVRLLHAVRLPDGATQTAHAPTHALDRPPASPSLKGKPTVLTRFWTVDMAAPVAFAWLQQHAPQASLDGTGTSSSRGQSERYLGYSASRLPAAVGAASLYLAVAPTGPTTSAIGAYVVAVAQQPRPAAEVVPLQVDRAVIGWALAPGGTPVRKELTGAAATRLARAFDALRVDSAGMVVCPMIPARYADITVTFRVRGSTWRADIPACPDIRVTRDGRTMPALAFGRPFLSLVKHYTGYLPHAGPPTAPGAVTPLVRPHRP